MGIFDFLKRKKDTTDPGALGGAPYVPMTGGDDSEDASDSGSGMDGASGDSGGGGDGGGGGGGE